ncbi:MAG: hypothetical protein H6679_02185 [Epsilonproteobacteria bacterium]|nr:hypothetical protein [Campylobacterota bacterium]
MNTRNICALLLASSLAYSTQVLAQPLTKGELAAEENSSSQTLTPQLDSSNSPASQTPEEPAVEGITITPEPTQEISIEPLSAPGSTPLAPEPTPTPAALTEPEPIEQSTIAAVTQPVQEQLDQTMPDTTTPQEQPEAASASESAVQEALVNQFEAMTNQLIQTAISNVAEEFIDSVLEPEPTEITVQKPAENVVASKPKPTAEIENQSVEAITQGILNSIYALDDDVELEVIKRLNVHIDKILEEDGQDDTLNSEFIKAGGVTLFIAVVCTAVHIAIYKGFYSNNPERQKKGFFELAQIILQENSEWIISIVLGLLETLDARTVKVFGTKLNAAQMVKHLTKTVTTTHAASFLTEFMMGKSNTPIVFLTGILTYFFESQEISSKRLQYFKDKLKDYLQNDQDRSGMQMPSEHQINTALARAAAKHTLLTAGF